MRKKLVDVTHVDSHAHTPHSPPMGLLGIRDLSTIETPPEQRPFGNKDLYLAKFDERVIKADAIRKGAQAGGTGITFVHNTCARPSTATGRSHPERLAFLEVESWE